MATERQIAANRANAKKSTGPKSRAGKARASANSRQHGLAGRVALDRERIEAARRLAQEIMDSLPGQIEFAEAIAIADAELDVRKARAVSNGLLASLPGAEGLVDSGVIPTSCSNDFAVGVLQLKRIERYLRRLQVKRDRLVRSWLLERHVGGFCRKVKCAERTQF
jgi:hypothetical protein